MKETETSHFWVGYFQRVVSEAFFEENLNQSPVSAFARDQGVDYFDHDMMECGWRDAESIQELVAGHSYSDQWGVELARRAEEAGLKGANFFIFMNEEEIEKPQSVDGDGFWLRYLGTIEYRI